MTKDTSKKAATKAPEKAPKATKPVEAPKVAAKVRISASRLKAVADKSEIMSRHGRDALAQLDAMLAGKDPEKSVVVQAVAELRADVGLALSKLAGIPSQTKAIVKEVEGLL